MRFSLLEPYLKSFLILHEMDWEGEEKTLLFVQKLAISQVDADIARGVLPKTVANFAELHDYVDANNYGDAFFWSGPPVGDTDDDTYVIQFYTFWNEVRNAVDEWLKARANNGLGI